MFRRWIIVRWLWLSPLWRSLIWRWFLPPWGSDFGRLAFGSDFAVPYRFHMDAFSDRFPVTGYRMPPAPFIFPDIMVWLLLASVFPFDLTYALYSFIQIGMSTVGWVLVCRRLGGGGLAQCVAVFAHALSVILLAYAGNDIFFLLLLPVSHAGVWAVMPWLLLAFLSFSYRGNVSLFVMLFLLGGSNLIVMPWFVGPFCVTLAVFQWQGRLSGRYAAGVGGGAVAAVVIGRVVYKSFTPFGEPVAAGFLTVNMDVDRFFSALGVLKHALFIIMEQWGLFVIWLLFMVVLAGFWFRLFRAGRHPALLFVMTFVLISIASSAMGPVVTTNEAWIRLSVEFPEGTSLLSSDALIWLRYSLPAVYFPLFVGWFLLVLPVVGRLPTLAARFPLFVAGGFLAIVTVAAVPSFFGSEGKSIRLLETPYAVCVRDAAQRLGWTAGIGPRSFWDWSIVDPDNPIRHDLYVENYSIFRGVPKDQPFWVQWDFTNRHSYSGEFQVVAVTRYADRDFRFGVPRDRNDACTPDNGCFEFGLPQASLYDAEMVRDFFGEPTEVVECEGVELFHYDPPFVYDFSNHDQTGHYPFPLPRPVAGGEDGAGPDG